MDVTPLFKSYHSLRERVTFFAAAKKVTKESGFSPREQPLAAQMFKRIFRLGILPRRKTAHIPVRRPTGLYAMWRANILGKTRNDRVAEKNSQ